MNEETDDVSMGQTIYWVCVCAERIHPVTSKVPQNAVLQNAVLWKIVQPY